MSEAYRMIGTPSAGGILVVCDHASNHVPQDIDLGVPRSLMSEHVAVDIGVAAVAERLAQRPGFASFLGAVSRLVCDYNRYPDAPGVVPLTSDGHAIPGNVLSPGQREQRLERFFRPYHAALAHLLETTRPALIVSLHSFTPRLASDPGQARPWHVGVLYNNDDRPARIAMDLFAADSLVVGDQEPYSGKLLNATMNRHAEAKGRPYLGVEIRQDQIADAEGQMLWAKRLERVVIAVVEAL